MTKAKNQIGVSRGLRKRCLCPVKSLRAAKNGLFLCMTCGRIFAISKQRSDYNKLWAIDRADSLAPCLMPDCAGKLDLRPFGRYSQLRTVYCKLCGNDWMISGVPEK